MAMGRRRLNGNWLHSRCSFALVSETPVSQSASQSAIRSLVSTISSHTRSHSYAHPWNELVFRVGVAFELFCKPGSERLLFTVSSPQTSPAVSVSAHEQHHLDFSRMPLGLCVVCLEYSYCRRCLCKGGFYCSKACQEWHWSSAEEAHKDVCPMKTVRVDVWRANGLPGHLLGNVYKYLGHV